MAQKGFKKLEIDPEFKTLIRPLHREEYRQLEANLAMEGCREAIIVWNDTIVDGHNCYEICNKLDIPYEVKEQSFSGRDEVIAWICANQLGRRNISEDVFRAAQVDFRLRLCKLPRNRLQERREDRLNGSVL